MWMEKPNMQEDFCITVARNFNIEHFWYFPDAERELSTPGRLTWTFSTKKEEDICRIWEEKRGYQSYSGREVMISIACILGRRWGHLLYLGREVRISIVSGERGDDIYRLKFGREVRIFIVSGERGENIYRIWGERRLSVVSGERGGWSDICRIYREWYRLYLVKEEDIYRIWRERWQWYILFIISGERGETTSIVSGERVQNMFIIFGRKVRRYLSYLERWDYIYRIWGESLEYVYYIWERGQEISIVSGERGQFVYCIWGVKWEYVCRIEWSEDMFCIGGERWGHLCIYLILGERWRVIPQMQHEADRLSQHWVNTGGRSSQHYEKSNHHYGRSSLRWRQIESSQHYGKSSQHYGR